MVKSKDGQALITGREVVKAIREQTDTVLLSYSNGKDSLAAWLRLRKAGFRVVPFYMYLIPDLQFVERSLRYYEQFFSTPIYRVPHPSLYRWLGASIFQSPLTAAVLEQEAGELPEYKYEDVYRWVKEDLSLPQSTWVALGTKMTDSLFALTRVKEGVIRDDLRLFFPIWDLDKARLITEIKRAGLKLPPDYRLFGRSFDGIYHKFLAPIKEHYPDDYARILALFPMAEAEIKRYEYAASRR